MEKNELIVNPQSKIVNYLFNACFLCVILAYDNLYPWFYENYVQLYYNPRKSDRYKSQGWLDFYGGWTCPETLLNYRRFKRWFFKEKDIISFIEDSIDNGNYIFTYIDEYFIKNSMSYGEHYVHDTFIYGYDKSKKEIKVIAYNNNVNFVKYSISYNDFENAFKAALELTAQEHGWNDQYCVLVKCKYDSDYVYKFKLEKFLSYLSDYLNSINSSLREKPNYELYLNKDNIYGISIYDYLVDYLNEIYEDNRKLFYPSFHTLYEHKVAINERLKYIQDQYYITEKFSTLVNQSSHLVEVFNTIRMLVMKYNIKQDREVIEKIISIIINEKVFETELLTNVFNEINLFILNREKKG